MRDRPYSEIESLAAFPSSHPDPLKRHQEEGRQAVRLAHARELEEIMASLSQRQSVLVQCDKDLAPFVWDCLGEKLPGLAWLDVVVRQGAAGSAIAELLHSLSRELSQASYAPGKAVLIRHLDLMTCTVMDQPRAELNEVVYWLTSFPGSLALAFWDPVFQLPKILEDLFPQRVSLQMFDREELWKLISAEEARKLSNDFGAFTLATQLSLYQYLSGMNVVEVRRILRGLDLDLPDHRGGLQGALGQIRLLTAAQVGPAEGEPAGYAELRRRLEREVIAPVLGRHAARDDVELRQIDALIPRGVILHGPPGTGKTEWARWLAQRLGATLLVINGPELKHKHVGETEAAIRRLFAQARRTAPALILIDEVDAMTPARDGSQGGFEASMVAQLLTEMDGLRREEAVVVVGTTNRLEAVDRAFKRPGRFGSQLIEIPHPDREDRRAILEQYSERLALGLTEDDVQWLVEETEVPPAADPDAGEPTAFSGDHLRSICLHLLRESLFPEGPADPRQRLRKAVERVRQGGRRPPETPPAPFERSRGSRRL